jgi:hypothetical protein
MSVSVSDHTHLSSEGTADAVVRPYEHAPIDQAFPLQQMNPVYRPPLSLGNQPSHAPIPAKAGFPNPDPLIEGFENGAVFRV